MTHINTLLYSTWNKFNLFDRDNWSMKKKTRINCKKMEQNCIHLFYIILNSGLWPNSCTTYAMIYLYTLLDEGIPESSPVMDSRVASCRQAFWKLKNFVQALNFGSLRERLELWRLIHTIWSMHLT